MDNLSEGGCQPGARACHGTSKGGRPTRGWKKPFYDAVSRARVWRQGAVAASHLQ